MTDVNKPAIEVQPVQGAPVAAPAPAVAVQVAAPGAVTAAAAPAPAIATPSTDKK